jgi:uncharacterized membrane protein
MIYSPLLPVHVASGIVGILSGTAAISVRKGSRRHAFAGRIFVASMLIAAAAAVYLAVLKHQAPNILAGILAFYLITTGWLTARRPNRVTSRLDWFVLLIPLAGGTWVLVMGLEKVFSRAPLNDGVPVAMDFFVACLMLLCAAGDVRMAASGGISGTNRLVRHLWRMCFGLFVATGSFFIGQQQVFPVVLRGSVLLTVLGVLPLALLIFWLFRVRFGDIRKENSSRLHS